MFLVMLQGFGQRRGIVLVYDILTTHYIYYIGNEIAIEGGVLLLARVIDYGIDLGYGKNGMPQGFVTVLPLLANEGLQMSYSFSAPSIALSTDAAGFCLSP